MENHLIKESDDAAIGEQNVDNINNSVRISNSNQIDPDELLAKIYNENINKINTLTNLLQIGELTAVLSFLFFLILLAIKLCPHGNFSFAFLLIPSIITICSVAIALNAILSLKNIIDITEKKESRTSTAFSYLLLNITTLFIKYSITLCHFNRFFNITATFYSFILRLFCIIRYRPICAYLKSTWYSSFNA